jgi:hypothetical protein
MFGYKSETRTSETRDRFVRIRCHTSKSYVFSQGNGGVSRLSTPAGRCIGEPQVAAGGNTSYLRPEPRT